MSDILTKILSNPATNYLLSFVGLGIVIKFALNGLHKSWNLKEGTWGLLTIGAGVIGGILIQASGLVLLPTGTVGGFVPFILAAFAGALASSAAAGWSEVNLSGMFTKSKDDFPRNPPA